MQAVLELLLQQPIHQPAAHHASGIGTARPWRSNRSHGTEVRTDLLMPFHKGHALEFVRDHAQLEVRLEKRKSAMFNVPSGGCTHRNGGVGTSSVQTSTASLPFMPLWPACDAESSTSSSSAGSSAPLTALTMAVWTGPPVDISRCRVARTATAAAVRMDVELVRPASPRRESALLIHFSRLCFLSAYFCFSFPAEFLYAHTAS